MSNGETRRRWVIANREKINQYWKAYGERWPDKRRNVKLRTRYGITLDIFRVLEKVQRWRCAICQKKVQLVVDHDHTINKVRALLCQKCNQGIGAFSDNPKVAYRAWKYLSLWARLRDPSTLSWAIRYKTGKKSKPLMVKGTQFADLVILPWNGIESI